MLLASTKSTCGPLTVQDHRGTRILTLNGQVQGGSFLEPSADVVRSGLWGPGPISSSAYSAGWLLAGVGHPGARALMIGLGSGAGAVAFLANFPEAHLDVVEIDPVVVEYAIHWFPLVAHYIVEERLEIHVASAEDFMAQAEQRWDLLFNDGYTGHNQLVTGGQGFHDLAHRCAKEIWTNAIGTPRQPAFQAELEVMAAAGSPIKAAWAPSTTANPDLNLTRNWILTTAAPDVEALDAWTPYDFLDDNELSYALHAARVTWENTLGAQYDVADGVIQIR